ncbi:MAG: 3-phosphoshikimate 1-carboxyvinyltransferase [Bacteroidetes bacterium]|nr:3-phosphoshikimate 1-carboxyvinyltransferase [Bacteroidota bacterium]MBS1541368.1 3-phosphoshikimate 1-carboxyvinyltransferase [Bacteroidota bacterium]
MVSSSITLKRNAKLFGIAHQLPSSKSISNRALILQALGGNQANVSNLSAARDTKLMKALIGSSDKMIDVLDAGTTMRFLTAYFAITNQQKILTGTSRMKQRPIGLLVEALQKIGADIDYTETVGFPPVEVKGFKKQVASQLEISGNVSSQYISALMMVAPLLPSGLTIRLVGQIGSVPYIEMTASLMKDFGAAVNLDWSTHTIQVLPGKYGLANVTVEADWSAASYWFAFVALAQEAELTLPNITQQSLQGDRVIVDIMEKIGVQSRFEGHTLQLKKTAASRHLTWDFTHCPDLAQTVLPVCAAKGITGTFTGMESLRIKETDRLEALSIELKKIGAELTEPQTGNWKLTPGNVSKLTSPIETYHDHRMAMGFAPWATLTDVTILSPEVVNKSYPGFWEDVRSVGIEVQSKRL